MLTEARIFTTTSLVLIHKLKQILNHKKKGEEDHHTSSCVNFHIHYQHTYILTNTDTDTDANNFTRYSSDFISLPL